MKRIYLIILATLIATAALLLLGCDTNRTKISSILNKPDSYINREVVVAGDVCNSYEVNLLIAEVGAYQVDDGTGKIWVITKNGVPAQGSKIGLNGTVSSGFKLGKESFGTIIREKDRRVK